MFKKSIPVILGALLLGTNSQAGTINCPKSLDLNKFVVNGQTFVHGINDDPETIIFNNRSKVAVQANGETYVHCYYLDKNQDIEVLTVVTKQSCSIPGLQTEEEGKLGVAKLTCKNSPACARIVCK